MSEQQRDEKVGALWSKSSARGEFFTGNVELTAAQLSELVAEDGTLKIPVVVFKNDRKTGNQPDWRILRAKPKATEGVGATQRSAAPMDDSDIAF